MAIMCINVRAIVGLSVVGGYFIYSCDHSGVRQCPLYGVERLSVSRRLEIYQMYAKNQLVLLICPFYGGCLHLGGSVKRGSTVLAVVVELEALALTRVSLLYMNAREKRL